MKRTRRWHSTCTIGLVLLTGCVAPFGRIGGPAPVQSHHVAGAAGHRQPTAAKPAGEPIPDGLVGLDEAQLRAKLGPPTSEEDRAPGKVWRYRDGACTVDLDLYPDVETRVYRALAYEVISDDGSHEKKHRCLAKLASRSHAR